MDKAVILAMVSFGSSALVTAVLIGIAYGTQATKINQIEDAHDALDKRHDSTRSEFTSHKLKAAENFVTKQALENALSKVEATQAETNKDIKKLIEMVAELKARG